jgi:hypothetical protein
VQITSCTLLIHRQRQEVKMDEAERAEKIRALNDEFRANFVGGAVLLTATVANLREEVRAEVLRRVREFKCFDKGNDPYGELDFATFEIGGRSFWFKIDYFDRKSMEHDSEDPSDPSMTTRVLTIGASEDW